MHYSEYSGELNEQDSLSQILGRVRLTMRGKDRHGHLHLSWEAFVPVYNICMPGIHYLLSPWIIVLVLHFSLILDLTIVWGYR